MLKISENKFSYTKFSLFSVFRRNEVISNANRNNSKKNQNVSLEILSWKLTDILILGLQLEEQ